MRRKKFNALGFSLTTNNTEECVERNIPEAGALDSLVALIQEHGKWVDAA